MHSALQTESIQDVTSSCAPEQPADTHAKPCDIRNARGRQTPKSSSSRDSSMYMDPLITSKRTDVTILKETRRPLQTPNGSIEIKISETDCIKILDLISEKIRPVSRNFLSHLFLVDPESEITYNKSIRVRSYNCQLFVTFFQIGVHRESKHLVLYAIGKQSLRTEAPFFSTWCTSDHTHAILSQDLTCVRTITEVRQGIT